MLISASSLPKCETTASTAFWASLASERSTPPSSIRLAVAGICDAA
jgi:hypothetical protein